jgi:lipopolysaccharide biosynthesis protein
MYKKARVIAFYLPQFHPIPENDKWWGKGFTEWTNVKKAKPLFKGHYQPRVPADLGYYDLRMPEVREAQAQMAREAGIEGFCYWHYWFGNGKRLLERPFNEVLASGKPDFPFCLGWANESWKGFAHGLKNRNLLIEQQYPGIDDYIAHFYAVLPAFKDKRYITVDGKPFFLIYKPLDNSEVIVFIETWHKLAKENGLSGIYFVGQLSDDENINQIMKTGVDAVNIIRLTKYISSGRSFFKKVYDKLNKIIFHY